MVDDDPAPSPEEMLRLIEQQQLTALRRFVPDPLLLYVPWGVTWMAGYAMFFLSHGFDGKGLAPITWSVALAVLMAGNVISSALLGLAIWRSSSQIKGESELRGLMYGLSWIVGICAAFMVASRFSTLVPRTEVGLLFTSIFMLVVGLLYMAGAALYRQWAQFLLGAWIAAVDIVGVALGSGWMFLLMSLLVGGGTIATGLWLRWRR